MVKLLGAKRGKGLGMTASSSTRDRRQTEAATGSLQGGMLPVPDPTVLTTQQLTREILAIRELIEARLDGMDKAINLIQAQSDRAPQHIDSAILAAVGRLQELHSEKFDSIATQFKERDIRTEQTSRDNKVAIDAALQAQKEAVGKQNESNSQAIAKSEAAFIKQIDQIGILITTMGIATDGKISDIKERLTTIEGVRKGGTDVWAYIISIASIAVAILAVIFKVAK